MTSKEALVASNLGHEVGTNLVSSSHFVESAQHTKDVLPRSQVLVLQPHLHCPAKTWKLLFYSKFWGENVPRKEMLVT